MTLAEFRVLYPDFSAIPDANIQIYLDLFVSLYGVNYGNVTDHLQGLYTAHRLIVFNQGGAVAVGAITSKSEGDVSRSYADSTGAASSSEFASSSYGVEFINLIRAFGSGGVVSGN